MSKTPDATTGASSTKKTATRRNLEVPTPQMRTAVDLLDVPYAYTQRPLMDAAEFVRSAAQRHVRLTKSQIEELHRLGLLRPLLRVRRDGRTVARLAREASPSLFAAAHGVPRGGTELVRARDAGRLTDVAGERVRFRDRERREVAGISYIRSDYLYSRHQLITVATLRDLVPYLGGRDGHRVEDEVSSEWLSQRRKGEQAMREVVIAVSALEARYLPDITGRVRLNLHDFDRYERWRSKLGATWFLRWLDVDAAWLRERAEELLRLADDVDPLGDWLEVVREADPTRLDHLRGAALNAIDIRIAAEVLLRYYESLVTARRAPALPSPPAPIRGRFGSRLKPQGALNRVLTTFGLSPHPRLVIVVEGATERLLLPRVMAHFGIRLDDDYVAIVDREGVNKDIASLVAYAAAPRAEATDDGKYLELDRPVTRILVASDPEGRLVTPKAREQQRQRWIDRIMRTLPPAHQTAPIREAISEFVFVETWRRTLASFEFAHFTDREIADAIRSIRRDGKTTSVQHVRAARARHGNLESLLGGGSKRELAEQLWPTLEAKIARAEKRGTERRIPIVRVLMRAMEIAHEYPRGGVVLAIEEPPSA